MSSLKNYVEIQVDKRQKMKHFVKSFCLGIILLSTTFYANPSLVLRVKIFAFLFLTGGQLLYNVVLVSAVKLHRSAVCVCVCHPPHFYPLDFVPERRSLCYIAASRQLAILHMVGYLSLLLSRFCPTLSFRYKSFRKQYLLPLQHCKTVVLISVFVVQLLTQ